MLNITQEKSNRLRKMSNLVDISDIFPCSGRGKGESEALGGGGVQFFIENPRREGGLQEAGLRGREGVCGDLGNWGGGANIFFGAKMLILSCFVF